MGAEDVKRIHGRSGIALKQATRLDDGTLHTVGREWVWDAVDVTDAVDTDVIVSARLGETVVCGRLTRPHARILNSGTVQPLAILNEDLAVREDVDASVDNDRVEHPI